MSQVDQTAASYERIRAGTPIWQDRPEAGRLAGTPEWVGNRRERLVHAFLEKLANYAVVQKQSPEELRFGLVCERADMVAVGRMRQRVYAVKLPYLLQELAADGTDAFDANSYVFAVWRGDQVVATLRATRYPYETMQHVSESKLSGWLGQGWDSEYIEWGRLLVDRTDGLNRLVPALVTYAGLYVYWLTSYRKYFGYARLKVRPSFGGFLTEQSPFTFQIPRRGEHSYSLMKGEFLRGSLLESPRWLGAAVKRFFASRA